MGYNSNKLPRTLTSQILAKYKQSLIADARRKLKYFLSNDLSLHASVTY